ncbi:MAG: toast rack family protein [Chloroflexota bacterium]|nr:toast rack family protein [Chloroflexota bacterium]
MKKQVIAAVFVLMFAGFACSFQNIEMKTTDTQVVTITEPLPSDLASTELVFKMTGGKFNLFPGADGLVNGTITYNVEQWEPEFTRSNYYYEIKQKNPYNITGIPTGNIENNWDFGFSTVLPLDLTIEGGASENTFDFSGLQLTNLDIIQGASETELRFDLPNPVLMKELSFKTGASSAKLYGLGNANFISMNFSCGAGDYTLDFTGTLSQESTVNIKAGVSNITIIIPADMNATIINQGLVSNINTQGTWLVTDETYTTMLEGPKLTILLDMAVGNINLIHE